MQLFHGDSSDFSSSLVLLLFLLALFFFLTSPLRTQYEPPLSTYFYSPSRVLHHCACLAALSRSSLPFPLHFFSPFSFSPFLLVFKGPNFSPWSSKPFANSSSTIERGLHPDLDLQTAVLDLGELKVFYLILLHPLI